jgi:hypothetical protein
MKQSSYKFSGKQIMLALLSICLFIPTNSNAQMFGGTIKTKRAPIVIPATITLGQDVNYFIASVYDNDYLPYTAPTTKSYISGELNADDSPDMPVSVQGSIPTTGVTVYIPATASASGTLAAYSSIITVPNYLTSDFISRDLTLSWAEQAYTSTTIAIVAKLTAVGGTLNAKQLDINSGIGNDNLGILMGSFIYPYNNNGNTSTFYVRDISAIPDKMIGKTGVSDDVLRHNLFYLPVMGEDGRTWLNNNLGAQYADTENALFNPAQQAKATNDLNAYGSLFQWGRKPDGHELILWYNSQDGGLRYSTTSTLADEPTMNSFFIKCINSSTSDWRITPDATLWATEASANNPCPIGFRVPTKNEYDAYMQAAGIILYDTNAAWASNLRMSAAGSCNGSDGIVGSVSKVNFYWSSSASSYINYSIAMGNYTMGRSVGGSIRCIKN